jgi:PTH1 family peptidyl-tRNA hydrolase
MANIFDLFKKIENPSGSVQITHLVVGLGNPGDKYTFTRHNAGFLAMDYLTQKLGVKCDRVKFKALTGEATINGVRVLLMKPQTYMNASGEAVSEATSFYKIAPENIIVISDDIMQNIGRLRIRKSGSAGGQKGLKSIIEHLKTENFPRIRIGVGQKPTPEYDLADWVLGKIPKEDESAYFATCKQIPDIVALLLKGDVDGAMCKYNGFVGK